MQATLGFKRKPDGVGGAAADAKAPRVAPLMWSIVGKFLLVRGGGKGAVEPSKKIAGFDLDGTLVNTKSGNTFATSGSDWKLFNEHVVSKVRAYHEKGYKIVIFSNQAGIQSAVEGKRATQTRERIDQVCKELGVPVQAFCATQKIPERDPHNLRKPQRGMWDWMVEKHNGDVVDMDLDLSFYVGDAAGRPGDHSEVDKGFAKSVKIPFWTPEEFFVEGGVEAEAKAEGGSEAKAEVEGGTEAKAEAGGEGPAGVSVEGAE